MSIDIAAAFGILKAHALSALPSVSWRWPDDSTPLAEDPVAFVYCELVTERGEFIEIGGGRGRNRFRNGVEAHAFCFVPKGGGLEASLPPAEQVAVAFRSFSSGGLRSRGATVHPVGEGEALVPPGMSSASGNYACAMVIIPLFFDQTA